MTENPLVVLIELTHAFERLGIDYVVVGSIASSIHGEYRASGYIDIVADIRPALVKDLVRELEPKFYIEEQSVSKAIARGRKFNVIHLAAVFKADIFAPANRLAKQQLARRQLNKLDADLGEQIWISTVEDMILYKLYWYRAGEGVSEIQWRDVRGMIGTRKDDFDLDYLRKWADAEDLSELLNQALRESE